jgi:hypothetical protein
MMTLPTKTISPAFVSGDVVIPASNMAKAEAAYHKGQSVQVAIPKEPTFDLPEGRFAAIFVNLKPFPKQTGQGPEEWIRFLLDVEVPSLSERFDTMAGRSFRLNLNPGSELRNWLTPLLGRDFFKEHAGQQINLDFLTGTQCEVELEHFQGKGYKRPLVVPARLFPVTSKDTEAARVKEVSD